MSKYEFDVIDGPSSSSTAEAPPPYYRDDGSTGHDDCKGYGDSKGHNDSKSNNNSADDNDSGFDLSCLRQYDLVFLVDDSGSMELQGRWQAAKKALEDVAMRVQQYDEDGIDIHFLNTTSASKTNLKDELEVGAAFDKVLPRSATPLGKRIKDIAEPRVKAYEEYQQKVSQAQHELKVAQAQYEAAQAQYEAAQAQREAARKRLSVFKGKDKAQIPAPIPPPTSTPIPAPRKCILVVITDGASSDTVDEPLYDLATRLDNAGAPKDQLGIQFVQVGDDVGCAAFLTYLDNKFTIDKIVHLKGQIGPRTYQYLEGRADAMREIVAESGKPRPRDMIDTVPYLSGIKFSGELLTKVMLGAINRGYDNMTF